MRVVHSLGWYFPDTSGGTETYVAGLLHALNTMGVPGSVVAATAREAEECYSYDEVSVARYPVPTDGALSELRGLEPHRGFQKFQQMLQKQNADVYHQHTWSRGCNIHHLRYATSIGLPAVLTVHVPSNICIRGTMMLNGDRPCDGEILELRCGSCWAQKRGFPHGLASTLARLPAGLSEWAIRKNGMGKMGSALATRGLVRRHRQIFMEASQLADRIIVLSGWLYDSLRLNGIPEGKLVVCRHGVDQRPNSDSSASQIVERRDQTRLMIGYLGRADPVKGIDIVVEALRGLPIEVPVELHIHAMDQEPEGSSYMRHLRELAGNDPRIQFKHPVPRSQIPELIRGFDLLAVPSRWLETGPLVVLEALAAGVPIIGSNLGGIREHVNNNKNGCLLPPEDISEWRAAIGEFAHNREMLDAIKPETASVRTMLDVAFEMKEVYQQALSGGTRN